MFLCYKSMMMKVKVVKFDPFFSHLNQQTRKVMQQKDSRRLIYLNERLREKALEKVTFLA
ncbi:hypothetical protein Hanom_Chr02g00147441 [Helianthus anomalus]